MAGTPQFDGFVDFIVKPYFSFLPGSPELWSSRVHDLSHHHIVTLYWRSTTTPSSFFSSQTYISNCRSAIHDYAEWGGGFALALGLLTRPAAGTLFITM